MNRFLYAEGNPWSMVDPSGHASSYEGGGCGPGGKYCGSTGNDQSFHKNVKTVVAKAHNDYVHHVNVRMYDPEATPTISSEWASGDTWGENTAIGRASNVRWTAPTFTQWDDARQAGLDIDAYVSLHGAQAYADMLSGNYTARNAGTIYFLAKEYLIQVASQTGNSAILDDIQTSSGWNSPLAPGTSDFADQVSRHPEDFAYLGFAMSAGSETLRGPGAGGGFAPSSGSGSSRGIETRYGDAVQGFDPGSTALTGQVESGATVFRSGKFGVQETAEGQYWAGENPLLTGDYNAAYGLPSSGKPDWVMGGTVKPGSPFVTRPAPGVGSNLGGSPEVVVNPGSVENLWFHMPD